MGSLMLINATEHEEVRIVILINSKIENYFVDRLVKTSRVGNIYKGVVSDVNAGLQAAFVDIGLEKKGFLHVSEIRHRNKRLAKIQNVLKRGDVLMVQSIRDQFGEKGDSVSTYISVPGRFLIFHPYSKKLMLSKKITDLEKRKKLTQWLKDKDENYGFIVRTSSIDTSPIDIVKDHDYLVRLWRDINGTFNNTRQPGQIYEEVNFVLRIIRDYFDESIQEIIVDSKPVYDRIMDFFDNVMPRYKNRVRQYFDSTPLFHKYNVEEQVRSLQQKRVLLPSGGNVVIEKTEGLVAIDVNSERSSRGRNTDEMGLKTNLEAAREIMRQLRLRDLGGLIIVDFITLTKQSYYRQIEHVIEQEKKKDKNIVAYLPMSDYGVMELTREKKKRSVEFYVKEPCTYCDGSGFTNDEQTIYLELARMIKSYSKDDKVSIIEIEANNKVIEDLVKRPEFQEFESEYHKRLHFVKSSDIPIGRAAVALYNEAGEKIS